MIYFIKNTLWKQIMIISVIVIMVLLSRSVSHASSSVLHMGVRGSAVRWLQQSLKERGYYKFNPDGYYGEGTRKAVMNFQDDNGIGIDGIAGLKTIALLRVNRPIIQQNVEQINYMWSVVNKIFIDYAVITDVATGLSFTVKRLGGRLHADVEPLTADDTATFKEIAGRWTWDRRAVMIDIDDNIFPASINAMPHKPQRIMNNNFDGHFCVHFEGSKVHRTGRIDIRHQKMVQTSEERIKEEGDNVRKYVYRGAIMLANRGVRIKVLPPPIIIEEPKVIEEEIIPTSTEPEIEDVEVIPEIVDPPNEVVVQQEDIKQEEVPDVQAEELVLSEQSEEESGDSLPEVQGLSNPDDVQGES
jgi:peptidoglycan hydrolase-like protein with peptidoglycan-binding domain